MVVVICVFCDLVVSLVPVRMVWTLSTEVTERVLVSRNVGSSRGKHFRRNRQVTFLVFRTSYRNAMQVQGSWKEWFVLLHLHLF